MPSSTVREDTWLPQCNRNVNHQGNIKACDFQNTEFTESHFDDSCGRRAPRKMINSNDQTGNAPTRGITTETLTRIEDSNDEYRIKHLIAGGIAGGVASFVTCPLDVIKTRQQSSGHCQAPFIRKTHVTVMSPFRPRMAQSARLFTRAGRFQMTHVLPIECSYLNRLVGIRTKLSGGTMLQHFRYIMKVEGPISLYKGLGPTLVGVVPSRAIYFFAYSNAKKVFTKTFGVNKDSSLLHLLSAASAGVCCTTATSPLWVIKTKLQLHRKRNRMTVRECCAKIWQAGGVRGFYRGLTASYAGILETVIHFVIYERLKLLYMRDTALSCYENDKSWTDYTVLMAIAAISKSTATVVAYPHEVVRTRLREEVKQTKYRGFFQTLSLVAKQDGVKALYRGLGTQIVRQVPNMAIIMGTYEFLIDASSRM